MGRIKSSITDIHGKTSKTEVKTNRFEDFAINSLHKHLGRKVGWWMVHQIEKRKLRK